MWDNLSNLAKKGMDIASDTIAPLLVDDNPWNESESNYGHGAGNEKEGEVGDMGGGENAEQEEYPEIPYDVEKKPVTGSTYVSVEPPLQPEGKNRMLREELEEMERMFHASTHDLQRLLNEKEKEVSKLKSELQLSVASASDSQLLSQRSPAYGELLVEVEMLRRKVRGDGVKNEKEVIPAVASSDDRPPRGDTEEAAVEQQLRDKLLSQQTANKDLQSDLERQAALEQQLRDELSSLQTANKGLQSDLGHQAADFRTQFESFQSEIATHEQNRVNLTDELTLLKKEIQVHASNLFEARKQAEISESHVSSLNSALDEVRDELKMEEGIILSQESERVEVGAKHAEELLLWKEERESDSMSAELQRQLLASAQEEVEELRKSLNTERSNFLPVQSSTERGADEISSFETTTVADLSQSIDKAATLGEMKVNFESQAFEMDCLRAQVQEYEQQLAEGKQACSALTNDVEQLRKSSVQYFEELKYKSNELDVLTEEMGSMRETALQTRILLEGKSAAMEDQSAELMRMQYSIEQMQEELGEKSSTILALTNELELLRQRAKEGLDDNHQVASLEEDLTSGTERISDDNRIDHSSRQTHVEDRERSMKLEVELKEALQKLELNEGLAKQLDDCMEREIKTQEALGETQSMLEVAERELEPLKQEHTEAMSSAQQLLGSVERVIPRTVSEGDEQQLSIPRIHCLALEAIQVLLEASKSTAEEKESSVVKLETELKEVMQKLETNEGIAKQLHDYEELVMQWEVGLAETQSKLEMTERELVPLKQEHIEAMNSAQQLLSSVKRLIPSAVSEEEQQLSIPRIHHLALETIQILWKASESAARRLVDVLSSAEIECKFTRLTDVINAMEEAAASGAFSSSCAAEDNNLKLTERISILEKEIFALGKEVSTKDKTCEQLKVIIDQLRSAHRSTTQANSVLSAERDQLATVVNQTLEELENQQEIVRDLENRLIVASSKAESARGLQNKVLALQESEAEARAVLAAEEIAVVDDLVKERSARQEALHEAQESGQSAAEALADLAVARADTERAQEAVVNMQRAFELFHEERAAEVEMLNQQIEIQKKELALALSECEKSLTDACESEKAAMDALNIVTERERVVAIELKSAVQEKDALKASALSNALNPSLKATEELVDKQLAANLIVKYISTHHDKRVLELIARVLSFTHDDLEAVGLERNGPGLMSEIMSTLVGNEEKDEEIALANLIEKGGTLGDAWVNFLLSGQPNTAAQQQEYAEKEAAANVEQPQQNG